MRLDPTDYDHTVGAGSRRIEIYGDAIRGVSEFNSFHRRSNRRPDIFFENSVVPKYGRLTLCRTSAMTTHGRDDEGLEMNSFQFLHKHLHHFYYRGNTSRPHPDSNSRSNRQWIPRKLLADPFTQSSFEVGDLTGIERLADQRHLWKVSVHT